jgi:uncharacterized protein
MLPRILILVALIALIVWWFVGRRRRDQGAEVDERDETSSRRSRKQRRGAATEMVQCAHCGVHLPHAEASLDAQGQVFCGPEHRLAGPR